ncbi:putative mitotic spindle checkpoint protein BUBR1-like [Capsicum annuum]|nr:putative mitotic spindle checkpoint protein BUBR1-like [Capsicum annuum]
MHSSSYLRLRREKSSLEMEIGFIISGIVNAHVGIAGEGKVIAPSDSKYKTSKLVVGICCYILFVSGILSTDVHGESFWFVVSRLVNAHCLIGTLKTLKPFSLSRATTDTHPVYCKVYERIPLSLPIFLSITGLPKLRFPNLPSLGCSTGRYPPIIMHILGQFVNFEKADWVLFNSFNKLEEEVGAPYSLCSQAKQHIMFLWVVKPDEQSKLPSDFIKETSGKGLVVTWCSQLEVVAHHTIRCFISHCRWNSNLKRQ